MKVISICLTDLPEAKFTKHKNGKVYTSLVVDDRKEPDQFGNDLTVYMNPSKEERAAKAPKVYVGSGKTYEFKTQETAPIPEEKDGWPNF